LSSTGLIVSIRCWYLFPGKIGLKPSSQKIKETKMISMKRASVIGYSAAGLVFGASQPANAQQSELKSAEHYGNHVMLVFTQGKTTTTVRCGYGLSKGKPELDPNVSGVSIHDAKEKKLTIINGNTGMPSLMTVEDFNPSAPAQEAVVHLEQKDRTWAARTCTYNAKTGDMTGCEARSPSADPFSFKQTLVFEAFKPCKEYFAKPGLEIKPKDSEPNSIAARIKLMKLQREKLRLMGFKVD
jgi:hypothetical protein